MTHDNNNVLSLTTLVGHDVRAALFDFDGVLMDTEGLYTEFWDTMGSRFTHDADFAAKVKGQTLKQIFDGYFAGRNADQEQIVMLLDAYERGMRYEYIKGAREFVEHLRRSGMLTAVVTSSNDKKMANVYRTHPEFKGMFDAILTSEHFAESKPSPCCYLAAMQRLGVRAEESVVFEDSFHGLASGRASGAFVVALATTNPREAIAACADAVLADFAGIAP